MTAKPAKDEITVDTASRRGRARTKPRSAPGVTRSNRDKIVRAALEGDTRSQIAAKVGLSMASVRTVLDDPDVKAQIEELRANRREALLARLEYSGQVAIAALVRQASAGTAAHPKAGDKGAVMAADSILDRIGLHRTVASRVESKSTSTSVVAQVPSDEFVGRSPDDLDFYAANGCWPEEA